MPRKLFLPIFVLVFGVLSLSFFATSTKADTCSDLGFPADGCAAVTTLFTQNVTPGPWYNQNPSQFQAKVFGGSQDEIFGERYTYAQINWIINSIASMLNPLQGVTNPDQFFQFIQAAQKLLKTSYSGQTPTIADYSKLGPVGLLAGGVTEMYAHPPASGVQEVKYTAQRILDAGTGTQPALAQGYGFTGLGGLDTNSATHALWTATRNMAYLIMVIILIAAGFLIMFRVKINPQTVVSLQTMIPKLIITMLLVTFSFAIAGLVIDMIYVVIGLVVGLLGMGGIASNPAGLLQAMTHSGFQFYVIPQVISALFFSLLISSLLVIIGVGTQFYPLAGLGIIIFICVWAFWAILMIRIFWMLLKAYVMIILRICIGPLQIMLDLIPGQHGFGPWIRGLISDASVFVVVPIMFIIQHIFAWDPFANLVLGIKAVGPVATNGLGGVNLGLPFLGSQLQDWNLLSHWGVGFVILTLTPKVADMIRDMLKIPPFKYGSAVNESLKPIAGPVGTGLVGYSNTAGIKGSTPGEIIGEVGRRISHL